jgi:hypothetical protein
LTPSSYVSADGTLKIETLFNNGNPVALFLNSTDYLPTPLIKSTKFNIKGDNKLMLSPTAVYKVDVQLPY